MDKIMQPGPKRIEKKVLIFTKMFLSPSMTFIYRQITSMAGGWVPVVVTNKHINQHLFPFERVHEIEESLYDRLVKKVLCRLNINRSTKYANAQKKLLEVVATERPLVVHAHFGPSALEILPIARELGIKMVTTFHGVDASAMLSDQGYASQLKDLFSYSKVITVSEAMADRLIRFGAPKDGIECVYIGVPINAFSFVKRRSLKEKCALREKITFLQAANFVEKKGHKYTLEAFAIFRETYGNCVLQFVGDGPLAREIKDLAKHYKCQDAVVFLGHKPQKEVSLIMGEADCFLHHSVTSSDGDQEGIPTVLMEAMATGLPVISTYHAGIPELIDTGVNGFLVEERDVKMYAKAMQQAVADDGALGVSAREAIERKFNMDTLLGRVVEVYDRLSESRAEGEVSV